MQRDLYDMFDFDDDVSEVYRRVDLREVENPTEETDTPGGRTALHGVMLRVVTDTEQLLAERDAALETVVIVVLTDGNEHLRNSDRAGPRANPG